MAVWPSTLPLPAASTFKETPPDNVIRSSMERGPDKVRRRTTANVRPVSFMLLLSEAQVEILDSFYVSDTFSGSEAFDFTHPRTLAAVKARFVSPPEFNEREAVLWEASVSLEILP